MVDIAGAIVEVAAGVFVALFLIEALFAVLVGNAARRGGYQPTRDLPRGKPPRGGSAARRPERGPHV